MRQFVQMLINEQVVSRPTMKDLAYVLVPKFFKKKDGVNIVPPPDDIFTTHTLTQPVIKAKLNLTQYQSDQGRLLDMDIFCDKPGHDSEIIIQYCTNEKCNVEDRFICNFCICDHNPEHLKNREVRNYKQMMKTGVASGITMAHKVS